MKRGIDLTHWENVTLQGDELDFWESQPRTPT